MTPEQYAEIISSIIYLTIATGLLIAWEVSKTLARYLNGELPLRLFNDRRQTLKIHYHDKYLIGEPKLMPPTAAHIGEWIDVISPIDVNIAPNSTGHIPLGITIAAPKGYEVIIAPRSSTFKKFGILFQNSMGVIDNTYCSYPNDEVGILYYSPFGGKIKRGDRIAQMRLQKNQGIINIVEADLSSGIARGGFGSTGN